MPTEEHSPPRSLGAHLIAAAQNDTSWVVRLSDDTERTLTTAEVVEAYNERRIDPATYVWTDGMHTWEQLQAVEPLVDALHAEADRTAEAPATSESSAMFSLAMLTTQARSEDDDAPTEDSGLIDLAALTAAHGEPAPAPEPVPLPDLFQPAAPAPAPTAPPAAAPNKTNRGLIIALASAIVVLSAALVFFIVRDGAAPTDSPAASAEQPAEKPAPTIAAPQPLSASAPDTAASAPVASASAPSSAAPAASASSPIARPRTPPAKTARTNAKVPPAAKQPPPTSAGCGCDAKDLDCQMRCAVRR
jgi:hypothetical protein